MRQAIIENGIVINVIVADLDFAKTLPGEVIECGDEVSPGWTYDNKKFIAPKPVTGVMKSYDRAIIELS